MFRKPHELRSLATRAAEATIQFLAIAREATKGLENKPSGLLAPEDMIKILAQRDLNQARSFCETVAAAQPKNTHARATFAQNAQDYGRNCAETTGFSFTQQNTITPLTSRFCEVTIQFLAVARQATKGLDNQPSSIPGPDTMAKIIARRDFGAAKLFCESVAVAQPPHTTAQKSFTRSAHVYGCLASDTCDYRSLQQPELEEAFYVLLPLLFSTKAKSVHENRLALKLDTVMAHLEPDDPCAILSDLSFSLLGRAYAEKRTDLFSLGLAAVEQTVERALERKNTYDIGVFQRLYPQLTDMVIESTPKGSAARLEVIRLANKVLLTPDCTKSSRVNGSYRELVSILSKQGDHMALEKCETVKANVPAPRQGCGADGCSL